MKSYTFLIYFLFIGTIAKAQSVVALHSAAGTQMFSSVNPFIDAYDAALDGDTIYLPGGIFTPPNEIAKQLTIIGAGYHPDSTQATFFTQISSNLSLTKGADHIYVEGLSINGQIDLKNNGDTVSFATFRRVAMQKIHVMSNSRLFHAPHFSECWIKNTWSDIGHINNATFTNCIFDGSIWRTINNTFENCIFMKQATNLLSDESSLRYAQNSIFRNNIFLDTLGNTTGIYGGSHSFGNVFMNNIFVSATPKLTTHTSNPWLYYTAFNNYYGVDINQIFVSFAGSGYSFQDNYELLHPSLYIGNDGTQVGLFGGALPFKVGAIPVIPYIRLKQIASQSNSSGEVEVEFEVEAQNN